MSSAWGPVPTPAWATDREPTDLDKRYFCRAYPNLQENFRIVAPKDTVYNCFPWSLGFNDRWIDGGTPAQMRRLYGFYFYISTQSASDAEIDIYMKRDAPQNKVVPHFRGGTVTIPNPEHNLVLHAHRNDNRDALLGSSSKLRHLALIRHDRNALVDNRSWNQVSYGQICGFYRKHPEHPLNPGKASNANLIPGIPPDPTDKLWEVPGAYPVGHPLEGAVGGLYAFQGDSAASARAASSLRFYAPYRRVPSPSQAAVNHAQRVQSAMYKNQGNAQLINQFEARYRAWKQTWFEGLHAASSNSITRTLVPEFDALVRMGPAILPLVVAKLCNPDDFMSIQLYNKLEGNRLYKVSPLDAPNYLVLQRHANLIVELNNGRVFK